MNLCRYNLGTDIDRGCLEVCTRVHDCVLPVSCETWHTCRKGDCLGALLSGLINN